MHCKSGSVWCSPVSLAQEPCLSGAFHKPPMHFGKQLRELSGRIPLARANLNRKAVLREGVGYDWSPDTAPKQELPSSTQDRVWIWVKTKAPVPKEVTSAAGQPWAIRPHCGLPWSNTFQDHPPGTYLSSPRNHKASKEGTEPSAVLTDTPGW